MSAHVSSIELAHSNATVWAEEDPTFKKEPIHANTGALSTAFGNVHGTAGLEPFEFGVQSAAIAAPVAVAEPIETSLAPGNSAGHGNSQQASESASAAGAVEPIETSLAPGNSAGHGNSQNAPQSAAINASDGAQAAAAASETGGADQELAFHFNNPAPSTPTAVVELEVLNDPPVLLGHDVELGAILKVGPTAVEEHATGHVNSGQPHAAVPLSHDLLI